MIQLFFVCFFTFFAHWALALPRNDDNLIDTIRLRRISNILETVSPIQASRWKTTMLSNGTWPDVDYTAGCLARRANWPAQYHILHVLDMASAWHIGAREDHKLLEMSLQGLDYWLQNDFVEPDCIDLGGDPLGQCSCETPGLWNRNWFDQVILMPRLFGYVCLLLQPELTQAQESGCKMMMARGYFYRDNEVRIVGRMNGANMLDVSSVGISLALFQRSTRLLEEATTSFYQDAVIVSQRDGIYADGSFLQHMRQLYTGNYGKDFVNQLLRVFVETSSTRLAPPPAVQHAFAILMQGTEWMIIANQPSNALLWEYSVIGRMISFRMSDKQASAGVAIDLTKILAATQAWPSHAVFSRIVRRLTSPATCANQGNLVGTRFFYISDYMVHRTPTFVVTLKMLSRRTRTSECNNMQNRKGFHLSDGSIFTYQRGDEYVDVFGAWDWELVPGTTVEYAGTQWDCLTVTAAGFTDFVGGTTLNNMGIAVMHYVNPLESRMEWKKTFFFFPEGYAVDLSDAQQSTSRKSSYPHQLVTTIDQRKLVGDVYVDGRKAESHETTKGQQLWHDRIGYIFHNPATVLIDSLPRQANWSDIGISSGNETQHLFTAQIVHSHHRPSFQYTVLPNVSYDDFEKQKGKPLKFMTQNRFIRGAYSDKHDTLAVAFWSSGSIHAPWWELRIKASKPCVLLLQRSLTGAQYTLAIADPTQLLDAIDVTLGSHVRTIQLPRIASNTAGMSVIETIHFEDTVVPSLRVPCYV